MNTPKDKYHSKSQSWDASNNQEGAQKSPNGSRSAPLQNTALKLQQNDNKAICLDTSIYSQELEDLPWQPSNLGEYRQPSLLKSTPTLKQPCERSSQEYQYTLISETISLIVESLTLLPADSPALAQVTQELEQVLSIPPQLCGKKVYELSRRRNPNSWWLNNQQEFSNEDYELFLEDSEWQDIKARLKLSRLRSLEQDTRDSDYLSFPTLTSGQTDLAKRPAGQTKCEKWFKDNGLIKNGSQLGTQALALTMGFPPSWFEGLTQQYSKNQTTPNLAEPQAGLEQDISQDEQLHQDKQQSPSKEFSISTQLSDALGVLGGDQNSPLQKDKSLSPKLSIPCLIKQPKQPEAKGVIRRDEGDRFLVSVDGEEISVSKLFVYPDFCKSDEQIPPTKQATPTSKTRRKKGDGTGYIYRRTVIRRGKQYQESYFRYRDESGKLKAKYIPQKLLFKVEEAESVKKPIADILFLLGGDEINRGEHSSISDNECVQSRDKSDELISVSRGEQPTPPSNKKRKQGDGTGYIECKPIKRSGKEYKQYWYHYEEWKEGDRTSKKCRYIPMRLVTRVQKMEAEKAPVNRILEVLIDKNKRSKK